jgi:hypothetical protein
MADFPSLKPSQRSLQLGEAPIKSYRALNGVVVRRSFGNRFFGYILDLTFENITEASLTLFWDHYHDTKNLQNGFLLPDIVFSGYRTNAQSGNNTGFIDRANRMASVIWFYDGAPQVQSVVTSYSTVNVKLIGELSYSPSA